MSIEQDEESNRSWKDYLPLAILAIPIFGAIMIIINQQESEEDRFVSDALFQGMNARMHENLFVYVDENGKITKAFCQGSSQFESFFGLDGCRTTYYEVGENYPEFKETWIYKSEFPSVNNKTPKESTE